MPQHFQLRAPGQTQMTERLDLQGSTSFYVSPNAKNETESPIRGSAIVSILGKNYNIGLNHKVKDYEDPEPSTYKWSYILLNGQTSTPASKRQIDTCYRQVNCEVNKISYGFPTYAVQQTDLDFDNVSESAGKYQSFPSMTLNGTVYHVLFWFYMYYKPMVDNGDGSYTPPTDDDSSAATRIARIPCRPTVGPVPFYLKGAKILYRIEWDTQDNDGSFWYDNWASFISAWTGFVQNYKAGTGIYTDLEFSYYIAVTSVDYNDGLVMRGTDSIVISEIADDNGDIHGAKNLYAIISQQKGYLEFHMGCVPVNANAWQGGDGDRSTWRLLNAISLSELIACRLPEYTGTTPGDYLNGSCQYTPEFKVRSSTSAGRGAPANVYDGLPITPDGGGFTYYYQYIGKPVIFGLYKHQPSGYELEWMKPYYKSLSDNDSEKWLPGINILGSQLVDPHKLNQEGNGLVFVDGQPYLGGVIMGKHYAFKLLPLRILISYGTDWGYAGKGVNEVTYYNNGNSAVTVNDLVNRAVFSEYVDPLDQDKNSVATIMSRRWSMMTDFSAYKSLLHIMMVPVLFTDFYLETENPWGGSGRTGIGRLWFSPSSLQDSDQSEFILRQVAINVPRITRI